MTLTAAPAPARGVPRHVVVAGMGGSAVAGDLVSALATDRASVPVTVWRAYGVPAFVGPESLVVATSYSGNTGEAVAALDAALRHGAAAAVVTSGGILSELARERNLPLVRLPGGLMPRFALGYLFFPLVGLVESLGVTLLGDTERAEALDLLEVMGRELEPGRPEAGNEAKRLARSLDGRIPVIYGSGFAAAVAYRWKTQLEENAKLLAFHGRLPEVDHNEIEGWRDPGARGFHAVFLRDAEEDEVTARRIALTRELIRERAGGMSEVWARGQGRLARLFSLIYVGDWAGYYLALLRGVDPSPVEMIEEIKRRLREPKPA